MRPQLGMSASEQPAGRVDRFFHGDLLQALLNLPMMGKRRLALRMPKRHTLVAEGAGAHRIGRAVEADRGTASAAARCRGPVSPPTNSRALLVRAVSSPI